MKIKAESQSRYAAEKLA